MKALLNFLKTTFLGGIFFLVPLVVLLWILWTALNVVAKIITPITRWLPSEKLLGLDAPYLLGTVVLLLICFLAGLVGRTGVGRSMRRWLEDHFLMKIPGYAFYRNYAREIQGQSTDKIFPVVMAHLGDQNWQWGFKVEQHPNGFCTVFIPGSPNPSSGSVSFLPPENIRPTDVPMGAVIKSLLQMGKGSQPLLNDDLGK